MNGLRIARLFFPLLLACATALPLSTISASTSPQTKMYLNVSFPNSRDGFVTAIKGSAFYILSTRDGGVQWTHTKLHFGVDSPQVSPGNGSPSMSAVQFVSPNTGWIMGYSLTKCQPEAPQGQQTCEAGLYATHNRGKKWSRQIALGQTGQIVGFQFLNPWRGWLVTSKCRIPTGRVRSHFAGGGMICGFDEKVLATNNGGRRWFHTKWSLANVVTFHFANSHFGWAITGPSPATSGGSASCVSSLYVTYNGGKAWKRILHLPHECLALGSFVSSSHGWVVSADGSKCGSGGCDDEVLRETQTGGKTWTIRQGGTPQTWTGSMGFAQQLDFASTQQGWITFQLGTSLNTEGGIATTSDAGRTWVRHLPCYQVQPGGALAMKHGQMWLAGSWVPYCSKAKETGLFHSVDWGAQWQQIKPKF